MLPGETAHILDGCTPLSWRGDKVNELERNRDARRAALWHRIDAIPELTKHKATILYEWTEADEHLDWALSASVGEIVDWARRIEESGGPDGQQYDD